MARELSPHGIHVAHFVIDGGIRNAVRTEPPNKPDSMLDPDAIAANYWSVVEPAAQRLDVGNGNVTLAKKILVQRTGRYQNETARGTYAAPIFVIAGYRASRQAQ